MHILDVDNNFLCSEPTKEVKQMVFSVPKESSPRPNGFGSEIYISCWEIVKKDVIDATRSFFRVPHSPLFLLS